MTFVAQGEKFTPSKVGAQFSTAHDPGALGGVGRYRGVPLPYGSADFDVPDDIPDKIAYVHERAYPYLPCMREAGAEEFRLHITYHYDTQCALGFSKDELRMILELDCDLLVDCMAAENAEPLRRANRRQPPRSI
jgi:hypothetical protein